MRYIIIILLAALSVAAEAQKPVFKLLFDNNGADSSGNAFAGSIQGTPTYSTTTKVQGTHAFYGNSLTCNWESNSAYTITNRTFSISVNLRRHYGYPGTHIIFANRENTGSSGFDIRWDEDNNRLYGRFSDGVTPNDFYSANSILATDTWYHLVIQVTGTGYVRVYRNNVKLVLSDSTVGTAWTNNKIISVGSGSDGTSAAWIEGYIDNFQYYSYVLTPSQVDSLYDNRATSFQLGEAGTTPTVANNSGLIYYNNYYVLAQDPVPGPEPTSDTIQYILSTNFENWTNADVQSLAGLMNKWDISAYNNVDANQQIISVPGHGNVWRSTVTQGTWRCLETYVTTGDTASDLWVSYKYYVDPNFNHLGIGGCYSWKMLLGFGGGNNWEFTSNIDTLSPFGRAAWLHHVGGSAGDLYPYRRDQIYDYQACGWCGVITTPKGYWINVTSHARVNRVGYTDGFFETFVDGVLVSKMTGLRTRSVSQGVDFGKFERFIITYFFGGNEGDICYASPRTQYVQMDDLVVYKYKPGANNYGRPVKNIGGKCSQVEPLATELAPTHLLVDETYTNASDTIYDVGANNPNIYWPPFKKSIITKTINRPIGSNISYSFLAEEFGYPDYGQDCEMYVRVYRGTGSGKTLLNTFGRTGTNNGRDPGYTNPSGTYSVGSNTATVEIYSGCNGGITRGVSIKYDSYPSLCFVGNSIMKPVYDKFVADGEPYNMTNIAVAGYTTENALTAWNNLSTATKQGFDYVLVQIGVNDAAIGGDYITHYQALITQINADIKPSCKIIAATMTPCRETVDYTRWQALNAAIRGDGATPITGIDQVMITNTTDLDANLDGYLDAGYNNGDGVHPNAAGTLVIKNNWLEVLP